jgi:anti-anti-sigma regulatory factor
MQRVKLTGTLRVEAVQAVVALLNAALAASTDADLHVDASEVTAIDTAGAQALIAFRRSHPQVELSGWTPSLVARLRAVGLAAHLCGGEAP